MGFFLVQQHLLQFCPEIYTEADNKFLLTQSNSLLEVSVSEFANEGDYTKLLQIKEDLIVYITGMKELGLIKNDNLLNTLIQHNETYLEQLFDHISLKIKAICEEESYVEVEVLNQMEHRKQVEFYGIELDQPIYQFPSFLPFSLMVKGINDSVQQGIDEIYRYCKNLFNDEDDYVLFYGSIDKLV